MIGIRRWPGNLGTPTFSMLRWAFDYRRADGSDVPFGLRLPARLGRGGIGRRGVEAVQAYPNAGSRYTFTGTFDVRAQKGFRAGTGRVDLIFDAYNLFTRNNEVEEYVVSGTGFRRPTAIQPPRSLHLGLRLSF